MASFQHLDARQKPPESIKAFYKYFQKLSIDIIQEDLKIIDFERGLTSEQLKKCREVEKILGQAVKAACLCFQHHMKQELELFPDVPVIEHEDAPGEEIKLHKILNSLICEDTRAVLSSSTAS